MGEAGGWTSPCVERSSSATDGLICLTGGRRGPLASLLASGQTAVAAELLDALREVLAAGCMLSTTPLASG